ncbi:response regulator [Hansschlegelia zhihuaiae]|uniref:Response regulator n=2 Tax=Hansschlegelia zhihuaiae TaxID=405005 RepID=A0A4V1KJ76_9HYPH|nr:response regulator [Hansschlegelia zhihuaiae]
MSTASGAVLVVDDDHAVRRSLQFMLELEGLRVRAFASGAALLAEKDLPQCGCLVVDQLMPGMTGIELIQALRTRGWLLPIVMIAGNVTKDLKREARRCGAAAVVEKPLHGADLAGTIRELLK